ncbi:hypothetical protein TKK_0004893 [Trichogramma kaykai]
MSTIIAKVFVFTTARFGKKYSILGRQTRPYMSHYLIILFRYISLLKQAGNDEDAEMLHEMGIVDGRQKMRDYDDETNDVLLRVVLASM